MIAAPEGFALTVDGLSVERGRRQVLSGIALSVDRGVLAIAGANGAGKTTLLEAVVGIAQPRSGGVTIHGNSMQTRSGRKEARKILGYLPQKAGFPGQFTAREAVEYSAWLHQVECRSRPSAAMKALRRFGAEELADTQLRRLSGGAETASIPCTSCGAFPARSCSGRANVCPRSGAARRDPIVPLRLWTGERGPHRDPPRRGTGVSKRPDSRFGSRRVCFRWTVLRTISAGRIHPQSAP